MLESGYTGIMRCATLGVVFCLVAGSSVSAQQSRPVRHPVGEMARAVEEFRVQTRTLGLRADSPASAKRNGTSGPKWHGRIFEYFRNDFLDAVPHEITQRGGTGSLLRRNQYGFNLAGPVVIPKVYRGGRSTYFSLSYEGVRENISRSSLRTIPTMAERTGDWSSVVDQAGSPLPIFDPRSTRRNPQFNPAIPVSEDNLEYQRDPFAQNRIPADRLDRVAQKALSLYPAPNAEVGPFFRNNYFVVTPETNRANGMINKVDHTFAERHRLAFGTSFSNGFAGAARLFDTAADPGPSDREFSSRRGSIEHVFTVSARTVNTFTFEASSDRSENKPRNGETSDSLSLAGVSGAAFPNFRFSPYLSMGRPTPVSRSARNTYVWTNAFSTRRGKHGLRVVSQWARYQVNVFLPQYPSGSFRFSPGLTSLPGIVNTGHPFASFLLGLSEFAEVNLVNSPSYFRRSSGLIALRDQYEVAKGFTINLGLNVDISTPRTERYDRQSTVDLTARRADGRRGALVAAGQAGWGDSFQPSRSRLEPSASLAWNPRGDLKTVIRAAFSRSYQPIPVYGVQWGTQGFTGSPTFISPNVQLEPAVTLSRGLPPPAHPLPDLRPEAADDTVADLMDTSGRQPVYHSASLSVERELPGAIVLSIGAAHSGGSNLLVSNNAADPNAISLDALAYRDRLNDEQFNRSLRPYPQYKGFELYWTWPQGRYRRDAGFLRMEKRTSQGLTMGAYYEFSKQMDDYSGGTQDFFNRHNEWSLTNGNAPHRFSLSYSYDLPLGASKPLLPWSDWRRYLVEGWSISGTTSVSSGEPLALSPQFNNTGGVISTLRVNVVPGVEAHVPQQGPDSWFNPFAFDQPPDFSTGSASRTHPTLLNPSNQNHDLSLSKRIVLAADRTLEITAVGFNFLNHGNWNDPDTVIGPASAPNVNAGKIIGSRGGRVVQLGMRLSF